MLRLYDFKCPKCKQVFERIVTDENEVVICNECMVKCEKQFPIFRINMGPVPHHGYYDDVLDTYITSNDHRKEVMKDQGVMDKGATPKIEDRWV